MKKNIPNFLTLGNLLAGCIGIDQAYMGKLENAAFLIGIGALFDFADGLAARMLKTSSPLGKELDSLADMVTFGVLPAVILLKLAYNGPEPITATYLVFMLPLFAAWRLAKFNIDTRQTDSFLGLPTPAVAIFVASLPFIRSLNPEVARLFINIPGILGTVVVLSLLMVIEIPLFSLKFKKWTWAGNQLRYSFLLIAIALLAFFQQLAIPMVILLYVVMSLAARAISKA